MSIHTAFNGVRRYKKGQTAFVPDTMIDVLYNYDDFLNGEEQMSKYDNSLSGKNIAVIGGGVAGLISTLELLKCGASVTLYEATDRLGGRMRSVYPNKSNTKDVFELGCMRFPPSSKTLFHYFKEFNIELDPDFPDPGTYGVNAELYYENTKIPWPGPDVKGDRSFPESDEFKKIGADFGAMLVHLLGSNVIEDMRSPDELYQKDDGTLYEYWNGYQQEKDPVKKKWFKEKLVAAWQKLINHYWDTSFYDAIYNLGQDTNIVKPYINEKTQKVIPAKWTLETMNAFGALGVGSGGFGPLYENGFIEILRIMVNGWEDKQQLVKKGISSFTKALIAKIEKLMEPQNFSYISKNSPITFDSSNSEDKGDLKNKLFSIVKVNRGEKKGQVKIEVKGLVNISAQIFDSAIITMSNNALEIAGGTIFTNSFTSSSDNIFFTKKVNTATKNLHMMRSSKLFIEVKTPFWKDDKDLPNNIQSDELFRGLYCLNYDDSKSRKGGVVLVSYTWEDDSTKLLGLSDPQKRYQKFLKVLRTINNDFADALDKNAITKTLDVGMIDWQKEAYYYGAFKLNYPGQDADNHAAYFQPWNADNIVPVYLAGDSMSFAGGWLEGPITSALNAVSAIIASSNEARENSPTANISPEMYTYNPSNFKEFSEKDKTSEK